MARVVISQSMYFPWVGALEQVRLADIYVHYDDVQFDRGFYNRVQAKTAQGPRWLTVPLSNHRRGQKIDEIAVDDSGQWRKRHRDLLLQAYREAPFLPDMLGVVDAAFGQPSSTLRDVSRASLLALVDYFGLRANREFLDSRELGVGGASSQRLLDIVRAVGGNTYITGHGAKNYLDHDLFEKAGISVQYMNYVCEPYPQLHGPFTPYVSGLDLVANCGRAGASVVRSQTVDWRSFMNGRKESPSPH